MQKPQIKKFYISKFLYFFLFWERKVIEKRIVKKNQNQNYSKLMGAKMQQQSKSKMPKQKKNKERQSM
jgi:hypothetical protein